MDLHKCANILLQEMKYRNIRRIAWNVALSFNLKKNEKSIIFIFAILNINANFEFYPTVYRELVPRVSDGTY